MRVLRPRTPAHRAWISACTSDSVSLLDSLTPRSNCTGAPGLIAGADPRRNGDDYPMTSLSDGLGPQKDPNSGRTRVESGPAGTHRPTTRRRSAIGASRGPRPET